MTFQTSHAVSVLIIGDIPSSKPIDSQFNVVRFALNKPDYGIGPQNISKIRAIAAAGKQPIEAELIALLPNLEIIANFGVGYDRVDMKAARAQGITITNTPDVLTEEVADLTLGLLIATVRRIPAADSFVRSGAWAQGQSFPLTASLRNRTIGIVGLGRIGAAVARRCAAMGLDVAYCARSEKTGHPYRYFDNAIALAEAVEVLIVTAPGGPETTGLIDARVLAALGSNGILINVSRGTVVHETALIESLKTGALLAAGLDVFEAEPKVPQELLDLENVVMLPHAGSATFETRRSMADLVVANLQSWFAGSGALNPVY